VSGPLPLHLLPLGDAIDLRRQRGIDTYRDGDASRPFVGDAAAEAYEEALDLLVYAEEMLRQGEARAEVQHVATLARQAADALGTMLRARGSAA
jgi:dsDNA-binding SOS-regulon protein